MILRCLWKILVMLLVLASVAGFSFYQLLSDEDFETEARDRRLGPAMHSGLDSENPWESYNQWQCFSLEQVEFRCAVYDEDRKVPSIGVETPAGLHSFDSHVEDGLDCALTLAKWRQLVHGGQELCIFAAQMRLEFSDDEDGDEFSLWYIERIKGFRGYWSISD